MTEQGPIQEADATTSPGAAQPASLRHDLLRCPDPDFTRSGLSDLYYPLKATAAKFASLRRGLNGTNVQAQNRC